LDVGRFLLRPAFRNDRKYCVQAAAVSLVTNYWESYGLFACSGLLFNHESPSRPGQCSNKLHRTISGEAHSLQAFTKLAFAELGLDYQAHSDFDPGATRPSDIACSPGDARKAERLLKWKAKVRVPDIVARMVHGEREGPAAVS